MLVYSLAHAKMRFGGSITHFDFFLAAGGGVVDSVVSSGIAGNGGFGLKFFLGKAFAFRVDLRDTSSSSSCCRRSSWSTTSPRRWV